MLIDLLNTELSQILNLLKNEKRKALSAKGNEAKHNKMRSTCINLKDTKTHLSSRAREEEEHTILF